MADLLFCPQFTVVVSDLERRHPLAFCKVEPGWKSDGNRPAFRVKRRKQVLNLDTPLEAQLHTPNRCWMPRGVTGCTRETRRTFAGHTPEPHRTSRIGPRAGQATPKPHQCDIKATSKRVDSQGVGTPKPPQSHPNTLRPPQCDPKATLKRLQSHLKAPTRRKQKSESRK